MWLQNQQPIDPNVVFHWLPGMDVPLQLIIKPDPIMPSQVVVCLSSLGDMPKIGIVDEVKPPSVDHQNEWVWVRIIPFHGPRVYYSASQLRRVVIEKSSLRAYSQYFSVK